MSQTLPPKNLKRGREREFAELMSDAKKFRGEPIPPLPPAVATEEISVDISGNEDNSEAVVATPSQVAPPPPSVVFYVKPPGVPSFSAAAVAPSPPVPKPPPPPSKQKKLAPTKEEKIKEEIFALWASDSTTAEGWIYRMPRLPTAPLNEIAHYLVKLDEFTHDPANRVALVREHNVTTFNTLLQSIMPSVRQFAATHHTRLSMNSSFDILKSEFIGLGQRVVLGAGKNGDNFRVICNETTESFRLLTGRVENWIEANYTNALSSHENHVNLTKMVQDILPKLHELLQSVVDRRLEAFLRF